MTDIYLAFLRKTVKEFYRDKPRNPSGFLILVSAAFDELVRNGELVRSGDGWIARGDETGRHPNIGDYLGERWDDDEHNRAIT